MQCCLEGVLAKVIIHALSIGIGLGPTTNLTFSKRLGFWMASKRSGQVIAIIA